MIITEASLSDSHMFSEINKSAGTSKKIMSALKSGVKLDRSYIEEQYIQIKRSRISPLVDKVLEAFDRKEVVLVYNKSVLVGKAVPFVCMKQGNKSVAFIFIADFSPISSDGASITIDMKKLYVLLESAYIAKEYYSEPWKFQRSPSLLKNISTIYANMILRILNKDYALSIEKTLYDNVNYSVAKFYLSKICELANNEIVNAYALKTCVSPSRTEIEITDRLYMDANIENISDLIAFISKLNPKMENLTFRYFFERWISTYGNGSFLGLDTVPYMIYIINNVLLGGFLINVATLSDMIKNTKGINLYYPELSKIL